MRLWQFFCCLIVCMFHIHPSLVNITPTMGDLFSRKIPSLSRLFIVTALMLVMGSCQKEVHINLQSEDSQIVVQGSIENGQPPFVLLNTTFGFFSSIDFSTLTNSFVHGAVIKVSDGTKTVTLKEYSIDTINSNKFYAYSVDTTNPANVLIGELGKQYTLSIEVNGKTYSSVTKIPYPKGLDTIWFGKPVFTRSGTPGNAIELFGTYTDPDTPGNYVRYYTRHNNRDAYRAGGVYDDELVNGKTIANIDLFAGFDADGTTPVDSLIYFYPGDTVTLKWCEIDKYVYEFWNTYQFAIQSVGNPFSSPINAKTNITNGALGVWEGHGAIYSTIIAH